jgi:hypothetical protein
VPYAAGNNGLTGPNSVPSESRPADFDFDFDFDFADAGFAAELSLPSSLRKERPSLDQREEDAGADYGEVDFDGGPVWRCEVSVFSRGWYWGGGRGGGESE